MSPWINSNGLASDFLSWGVERSLSRNADVACIEPKSVGRGVYCFFAGSDVAPQQRRLFEAEAANPVLQPFQTA